MHVACIFFREILSIQHVVHTSYCVVHVEMVTVVLSIMLPGSSNWIGVVTVVTCRFSCGEVTEYFLDVAYKDTWEENWWNSRCGKKSFQKELLQLIITGISKLVYIYNGLWNGISLQFFL